MSNEELQQLKALAEAATPGPWERDTIRSEGEYGTDDDGGYGFDTYEVTDNTGLCIVDCLNNDNGCVEVGHDGHAWDEVAKHNTAYIAAANPAAILALIAKVESLEADAARLDFVEECANFNKSFGYINVGFNVDSTDGDLRKAIDMEKEKA